MVGTLGLALLLTGCEKEYVSMYDQCVASGKISEKDCREIDELFWNLGLLAAEKAKRDRENKISWQEQGKP